MRYLLDTNICIHLMDVHPPHLIERFRVTPLGDLAMSVVTYAELRHGIERSPAQDRLAAEQALRQLLRLVPALPFDMDAAKCYGVLAAAVRDRRRDALDRLIAAHAVSLNAALITNNEADFQGYPGLRVENWVHPAA
ncbi:MAG: type II toxin-antitoxin system VapC family toxin [Betaproteobacteria bacterium]|nr:type II toxin-antitoxin system VapC family toxin [Betaproteobacteria bacterium]